MEFNNLLKSIHMIMCVVYVCTCSSVEGSCSDCITCLDSGITPNEGIRYRRALRLDSGDCPSPGSTEYSILQQIDYMFRSSSLMIVHTAKNRQPAAVPCNAECNSCVISAHKPSKPGQPDKPDKQDCSIEKLDKPYLEGLYDGVFFNSASYYKQHALRPKTKLNFRDRISLSRPSESASVETALRPETQFSIRGRIGSKARSRSSERASRPETQFSIPERMISKSRPSVRDGASVEIGSSINCPIERRLKPYTSDMVDPVTGKHWYGVWFMNSGASPSYQFYEAVNCAPRASSRRCSQMHSQRTMLVTSTKPHPTYGHKYSLFYNYGVVSNIKFYGVEIAAHCVQRAL